MPNTQKTISSDFKVKGLRDLLLIHFTEGEWEGISRDFFHFIDERKDFFQSAKIALDMGERKLRAVQMADLRDGLAERQISLVALFSESTQTKNTARTFGLETDPTKLRKAKEKNGQLMPKGGTNAILYDHTLRSGTKVKYPGSVVVIGDVNPGAEVIADGNVVVWGCIRGKIVAGANGDEEASIFAMSINPLSLRIANIEAEKEIQVRKPVKIYCLDSRLEITTWKQ